MLNIKTETLDISTEADKSTKALLLKPEFHLLSQSFPNIDLIFPSIYPSCLISHFNR